MERHSPFAPALHTARWGLSNQPTRPENLAAAHRRSVVLDRDLLAVMVTSVLIGGLGFCASPTDTINNKDVKASFMASSITSYYTEKTTGTP